MSVIVAAHELPCGTVTSGHVEANPTALVLRSSASPQTRSAPPHALQIALTFFVSALPIDAAAVASGHGPLATPMRMRFSHFWSARASLPKNFSVCLPMARWHLSASMLGGDGLNEPYVSATAWSTAAVATQERQSAMSLQFTIVLVHDPLSKFGHAPTSQPIVGSGWSSASPHW